MVNMEHVTRHAEGMIDEFSELRRINLFTGTEVMKLIKNRKEFEYKVNGVNKNVIDFKAYIKHEKDLLREIKLRRDKLRISERKSSIEFRILKRIKDLYEIAVQKFPNDYPLSLAYFKFCKSSNNNVALNHAINNILKNYSHNPDTWILVAKYYAREKNDKKDAINHLLKGLTIHKDNHELYKEAIELELCGARKTSSTDVSEEDLTKDKALCNKIITYLDSIFQNIQDFKFYIEILEVLQRFPVTAEAQNKIVAKLLESHSQEDMVWHTLAQRELNGLHYNLGSEKPTVSSKFILERCFKKYQEGLKIVTGEKKTALYHHYLDCLITAHHDRKVAFQLKTKTLQMALEDACEEDILTEKHYIVWIELLDDRIEETDIESKKQEIQEEIVEVLEKGLESIPQSVELWNLRLKAAVMTDKETEVNVTLKRGIQALNEKALPLWLMALRFHMLVSDERKIDEFYQSAIYAPPAVSNVLKPQYILWLGMTRNIEEIRAKYNIMANQKPYCKELHTSMLKVEENELTPNTQEQEKIHKYACDQFGKEDVDVWISYVQFLSQHRPTEVSSVYKQAQSKLSTLLFPDFQERYITLEEYNKSNVENPTDELFKMLNVASEKNTRKEKEAVMFPGFSK